jgi:hypothetical protein
MVLVVDAVFDPYWADLVRHVLRRGPMARTKLMTTGAVATIFLRRLQDLF